MTKEERQALANLIAGILDDSGVPDSDLLAEDITAQLEMEDFYYLPQHRSRESPLFQKKKPENS